LGSVPKTSQVATRNAVARGQGPQPVRVLAQLVLHDHQLGAVEAGLADQLEGLLEREHEERPGGGQYRGHRGDRRNLSQGSLLVNDKPGVLLKRAADATKLQEVQLAGRD
jgi:hypothetical protein